MITKLVIAQFVTDSSSSLIIDVRSPIEYNHAHLPGAINIPVFTDEERKQIGTMYKQQSRAKAIKYGLDLFGPKMRSIVEQVEAIQADIAKPIYMYCARGGMRSGAMAWLLGFYGYNIMLCMGGYKAFRNFVLSQFTEEYDLQLLGGYTGTGKTKMLQTKTNYVDIEALANHKGSVFGGIGMEPQPSQEMFENKLAMALMHANKTKGQIWLEDESQRLGKIIIPNQFWLQMRKAPLTIAELNFEARLENIIAEYGSLPKDNLATGIEKIQKRLGGLEAKNAQQFLEEGNIKACFEILLRYYDKQYQKGMDGRVS